MVLALPLAILLAGYPARAADHPANDPLTCRAIWQSVGLPDPAADDGREITTVCHIGYITGHNNANKTPDWVVERITAETASQEFTRPDVSFKEETALPPGRQGAVNADYADSGMDRGHQAASADFSGDREAMIDTFFYSNAVPQSGRGFNQQIWRELEDLVQHLARERGEVVVITGPVNLEEKGIRLPAEADACGNAVELTRPARTSICDANDTDPSVPCGAGAGAVVPAALYKIIYDPALQRVNAYVMPNIDHRPGRKKVKALTYLSGFRVGVSTVEALTGLRFFTAPGEMSGRSLRETCPATMLH
ncbi:DNA/RNA non-specific endonuclease [Ancylobacter radicis]|uniref:Endonuclease n=1 Tax=Ancylobacter radicis TaxID=2836179 RepID=A0ABS5RAC3_9HYPH|nr:DNA/RNA non-specific endonuclease [Ancylobacter radicis]MBS9478618.1 DNA/RNA non-specific endonuclease [Ancylobacter radicis]